MCIEKKWKQGEESKNPRSLSAFSLILKKEMSEEQSEENMAGKVLETVFGSTVASTIFFVIIFLASLSSVIVYNGLDDTPAECAQFYCPKLFQSWGNITLTKSSSLMEIMYGLNLMLMLISFVAIFMLTLTLPESKGSKTRRTVRQ